MYKTAKKEQFSVAFMKALAAPLGFNPDEYDVDDDSVDIFFKAKGFVGKKIRNPQLHFQLKCTHKHFDKSGTLHFQLPIKNYNDLIGEDVVAPTYLIIVNVPENETEWISCNMEDLVLKYSAYWVSLRNHQPIIGQDSITIAINKTQKFNSVIFQQLMDNASEGIAL